MGHLRRSVGYYWISVCIMLRCQCQWRVRVLRYDQCELSCRGRHTRGRLFNLVSVGQLRPLYLYISRTKLGGRAEETLVMTVSERVLWFVAGAAVAGTAALLLAWQPNKAQVATNTKAPDDQQAIARQLERIAQRLDVIETSVGSHKSSAVSEISNAKPAEPTAKVSTAAQPRASESAAAIIRQAIATGTWSRSTAAEFNAVAGDLRGEERFEFVRQLSVAINEGRLKIEPGAEFH